MQDEAAKETEKNDDGYNKIPGTPQMAELDMADAGDVKMSDGVGDKPGTPVMADVKVAAADLQLVEIHDSPVKEKPMDVDALVAAETRIPKDKNLVKAKAKAKGAAKAKAKGKAGNATKGRKPRKQQQKRMKKNKKATKDDKTKNRTKTVKPKAKAKASSSKRPAAKMDPVVKKMHSVTRRSQLLPDAILQGGKLQCLTWKT